MKTLQKSPNLKGKKIQLKSFSTTLYLKISRTKTLIEFHKQAYLAKMLNTVLFLLQLLPLIKTNQPSVATKDGVLFNLKSWSPTQYITKQWKTN